jgi:enoyl-CoA hydratase/carnithine racemase
VITLNRPEHRNTWTAELERHFYEVLDAADRDRTVRVAVLTGAGKTFCPGVGGERLDEVADRGLDLTGRMSFSRTLAFRKPLIAAINGGCAGVGLAQALMCDIRFAASTAKLSTAFARRGLPAEQATSWLLPRLSGLEHALDLLLSGRTVTADEALQLGLLSRVVPPDDLLPAVLGYAGDIAANCGPEAMAVIKRQVLADLDTSYPEALQRSIRTTVSASVRAEFREGVSAFLERRTPTFAGLASDFDPAAATRTRGPANDAESGAARPSDAE